MGLNLSADARRKVAENILVKDGEGKMIQALMPVDKETSQFDLLMDLLPDDEQAYKINPVLLVEGVVKEKDRENFIQEVLDKIREFFDKARAEVDSN